MALKEADIICTTPEKWDGKSKKKKKKSSFFFFFLSNCNEGVSRSWQNRGYVSSVGLIIIDEIHLLGEGVYLERFLILVFEFVFFKDRGPILEVIVSRMRHIASTTKNNIRVVGLSKLL